MVTPYAILHHMR